MRELYAMHARRDIEGALAMLAPDVEWPNVAKGTVLHGRDEVRAYWTAQFAAIDPHVEPTAFAYDGDKAVVTVHQIVRDLEGKVLLDSTVTHTYTFDGNLVVSMHVGAG